MTSKTQSPVADFNLDPPSDGFIFEPTTIVPGKAAEEASEDTAVLRMLEELTLANALWNDPASGPRGAGLAALRAVLDFLHAKQTREGEFTRALDLLYFELQNAPPSAAGAILPSTDSADERERKRKEAIRHIKAAAACALERLHADGIDFASACLDIEAILRAHGLTAGKKPLQAMKAWRSSYVSDISAMPFKYFPDLPIADDGRAQQGRRTLDWLSEEIERVANRDIHPNIGPPQQSIAKDKP